MRRTAVVTSDVGSPPKATELHAVVIRADGTEVDLGQIAGSYRNPLRQLWFNLFGQARFEARRARLAVEQKLIADRRREARCPTCRAPYGEDDFRAADAVTTCRPCIDRITAERI